MDRFFGEVVDRLITVETIVGLPGRDFIRPLYEGARERFGAPLTALAAQALGQRLAGGGTAILVTGAGCMPFFPFGETDGPPGTAILGRALQAAFGVRIVLVGAERYLPPIRACWEALPDRDGSAMPVIEPYPIGPDGEAAAHGLMDIYRPSVIVTCEALGPAEGGVIHARTGRDITADNPRIDHLLRLARSDGALTLCIGDGGNEAGMGAINDVVRRVVPLGPQCVCPCRAGIADVTPADLVVVANISDWGALGVVAALALSLRRPALLPMPEQHMDIIRAAVDAGAVDGVTCRGTGHVDGTALETQGALVQLLRQLVISHSSDVSRPY